MGISIWQLLIILAIVIVLFGAKRLRTLGTDLGTAVSGFRDAVREGESESESGSKEDDREQRVGGHLGSNEGADEDFADNSDSTREGTDARSRD